MTHRLPVLDGLRAISILLVLGAHMLPLGPKILQLNHAAGAMGMSLFFALSGFLIASTLLREAGVSEFVVKRLARIVPLAYAYAFLVFTLVVFDPQALFWTAAFVVNYVPEHMNAYNAHFWSLCVEVHFYLAIGLVVALAGTRGLWIVWPACLLVTLMRIEAGAYTHIQTHLRVDEILAGACVATVYRDGWRGRLGVPLVPVLAAGLLWFLSSSPYGGWFQFARPYATGLLLAAVLSEPKTFLTALLASAPLRYIARISYALYVVHPLTIQGWFNTGSIFERYALKRPISFAATFFLAHMSTLYWEAPWTRAARRWAESRRVRMGRPVESAPPSVS